MKRDDFFKWIASVESEYHAARLAVTKLREEARSDSKNLTSAGLLLADVKKCLSNLEATYIVRLFAEFESALRIYWKVARKRKSSPQISSLIASVAALRVIPDVTANCAHAVREFRNSLVHENIQRATLTFGDCRSHLAKFLSFLPPEW